MPGAAHPAPGRRELAGVDGLLGISDTFYGMVRPPYLQVVWPDKHGRFPWEPGFQAAFDRMQPLLWLHRDDNPPSPWTRLDQLCKPGRVGRPGKERAKMMPMSSPWWFDELPEYMTEAEYRDLSEEISRTIEIVHGHVIKCESPTPRHNRIARRLANALEAARSPATRA